MYVLQPRSRSPSFSFSLSINRRTEEIQSKIFEYLSNDGKLDRNEYREILCKLVIDDEFLDGIITKGDKDGDGLLSVSELVDAEFFGPDTEEGLDTIPDSNPDSDPNPDSDLNPDSNPNEEESKVILEKNDENLVVTEQSDINIESNDEALESFKATLESNSEEDPSEISEEEEDLKTDLSKTEDLDLAGTKLRSGAVSQISAMIKKMIL